MKTLVTAFVTLFALLATTAWMSDRHDLLNSPKYAPNFMHRVQVPVRPDAEDPSTNSELKVQVASLNREMPIKTVAFINYGTP